VEKKEVLIQVKFLWQVVKTLTNKPVYKTQAVWKKGVYCQRPCETTVTICVYQGASICGASEYWSNQASACVNI